MTADLSSFFDLRTENHMSRIVITLDDQEKSALCTLANSELRNPQEQVRYILRLHLTKSGLLPNNGTIFNPASELPEEIISTNKKG
jgi:hypothetical protein